MTFSERRLEQFAMQTDVTPESRPGWVNIVTVGKALGMSAEESIEYANLMREEGWANTEYSSEPWMRLTIKGRVAIQKLRRPHWQRWMEKHSLLVSTLIAIVAGFAGALLADLAFYILTK